MADTYSVDQQQDASSQCCACGGGQRGSSAGALECGSDAAWEDARGSTCARYDTNPGMCSDAEQYAVTVEVSASDVCCACGGGLHAVNKGPPFLFFFGPLAGLRCVRSLHWWVFFVIYIGLFRHIHIYRSLVKYSYVIFDI